MKRQFNHNKALRTFLRFSLQIQGFTIVDLAKAHGISASTLRTTFYRPFPKGETIISNALGRQPQELWPLRYDKDGKPNRVNRWYLRKSGLWKPKNIKKQTIVKEKIGSQKMG
jgi:Ner family transcriptional regulator